MVIKLHDAVIAYVTVGGALRTENVACLTKLELKEHGAVRQRDLQVVHARLRTDLNVFFRQVSRDGRPATGWYDARLSRCCMHHEEVG